MKNVLLLMVVVTFMSLPVCAGVYLGNSDWTQPFVTDQYTKGLWHFDEQIGSSTLADSSGNNMNGVMVQGLDPYKTWKPSMSAAFSNCASTWWNSSTDGNYGAFQIDTPADPELDPLAIGDDQDLTIEFWAKFQYIGDRYLIDKAGICDYMIHTTNGTLNGFWAGYGGWENAYGPAIPTGVWKHYAITFDRTSFADKDIVTFWIDGVQQGLPYISTKYCAQEFAGDLFLLNTVYTGHLSLLDLDELRISDTIRYGIPEPMTLSLVLAGGLLAIRRRQ